MLKYLKFILFLYCLLPAVAYPATPPDRQTILHAFSLLLESGDPAAIDIVARYYRAHPKETKQEMPVITDSKSVTEALALRGIFITPEQWIEINNACFTILRNSPNYHPCRFQQAVLYDSYRIDKDVCDKQSSVVYPQSLTEVPQRKQQVMTVSPSRLPGQNRVEKTTLEEEPLTKKQLKELRQQSFWGCMQNRDWKNPFRWQDGKNTN